MRKQQENGFSLIETIIALIVLTVGILATVSAITYSLYVVRESEKITFAKEHARSTMETIFSIRDLQLFDPQGTTGVFNWETIVINDGGNSGVFLDGWNPIRENPGIDGIYGTADDSCVRTASCTVGSYINNSPVVDDYERKIEITDINQNGVVRKRYIVVRVRYMVGSQQREVTESTILANYPVE